MSRRIVSQTDLVAALLQLSPITAPSPTPGATKESLKALPDFKYNTHT